MPVQKGTVTPRLRPRSLMGIDVPRERPVAPSGGSCEGRDTNIWFPDAEDHLRTNEREALRICHECPVQLRCLMYSLEWERFGIWGGMTEHQRHMIRRSLRITMAKDANG